MTAQYIWSIVATADGNIYAATGPNGKLFEIHPDGSNKVLFETDENNLLSMTTDGKDLLYVGSDPNGHIYRVNRKTGESFVLYDAAETEISALTLDAQGICTPGTAESTGEDRSRGWTSRRRKIRPAGTGTDAGGGRFRRSRRTTPEPPKLPLPGPGEPNADPASKVRTQAEKSMVDSRRWSDVAATRSGRRRV